MRRRSSSPFVLAAAFAALHGACTESVVRAADGPPPTPPAIDPGTLRVATYNINYGNPDLDAMVAALRETDADIVAMQEINDESREALEDELADEYPYMEYRPDKWAAGYAFLSRIPIADTVWLDADDGPFGAWIAVFEHGGHTLQVANLHLHPNLPERGESATDFALRALGLETVRIAEVEDVLAAMDSVETERGDTIRMLAGDLNTLSSLGLVARLRDEGFVDAFGEVHDSPDRHVTWNWELDGRVWSFRLDYVFVEDGTLSPVDAAVVVEERASDHFPVVVHFSLP